LTGNPEWSGVSGVPVQILDKTSMLGVPFDSLGSGRKTLMAAAQEEIVLQSPYLMLTEEGMQALQDAAERGVKVTVITNSPATGDSGTVQAHFLLFWREILARLPGGELKVFTGDLNLHAKAMVIDRRLVLMGSDNYDFFGSEVNGEVVTALDSSELAAQVLEAFQQDMSNPLTRTRPYLILRGADGEVVRIPPGEKDAGRPVSVYGPEDHTEKGRIDRFKSRAMKKLRSIKGFEALMQFPRHLLKD
jgi:phosphatidylserine/phosphatidylglycerophosphate/cardiolipin synthase-like enzyme